MRSAQAKLAADISSLAQELESAETKLAKIRQERREQDIKFFGKSLDDEADAKKAAREQAKKGAKEGARASGEGPDGAGIGSDEVEDSRDAGRDDAEGAEDTMDGADF